jgi:hypothetical protein
MNSKHVRKIYESYVVTVSLEEWKNNPNPNAEEILIKEIGNIGRPDASGDWMDHGTIYCKEVRVYQ